MCRLGNERWLDQLPWTNTSAFRTAKEQAWYVDGQQAGTVRKADQLSFVKIKNAGHMSPMDQPQNLLDMITNFVHDTPLNASDVAHVGSYSTAASSPVRPSRALRM